MVTNLLTYWEHYNNALDDKHQDLFDKKKPYGSNFKKQRGEVSCFSIIKKEGVFHLNTSYCIGIDWIDEINAIYIEPKLNANNKNEPEEIVEINYLQMLFSALPYIDSQKELDDLFKIKWDKPLIEIHQTKDLLTPLLVIQYLNFLKTIVRKGLKKSYYKVEQNLNSKVKGKVLVGQTIKQNSLKNKQLYTYCSYEEFGINNLENRLLKKALIFIKRYLPTFKNISSQSFTADLFNFITPAFENVSEEINLNDIKYNKPNTFYKEYTEATRLAKLILKRFGYNIANVEKENISTPPFWIDMSKLFEYYILGLLKKQYPKKGEVLFQFKCHKAHEIDYLLNTVDLKLVIDAKYKPQYKTINGIDKEDFRQISGYARLKKVYDKLKVNYDQNINCLIIYPDLEIQNNDLSNPTAEKYKIDKYVGFYKLGVNLPIVK
ncbi:5-methylcytosine restriction system specificity protein McrC [Flavobacterium gyeonganense]|uniref:Restriction endonuclease n=1 Tax=Flavobacterium gyeonganense TaxID=1310418 RepID=A0ABV5H6U2_9FLAO|nr:restriction endonuclease [Flavobacterium gyeonganense]